MSLTASTLLANVPDAVGKKLASLSLSHVERGIFPSEMAAACSIAEAVGAQRIIESGRWLGYSTEVLSKYFINSPIQIDSLEYSRSEQAKACERRLASCKNVRLLYGDTTKMLPGMLEGRPEPTALLFDGPKGLVAVRFLRKIMDTYPQVRVALIHDCNLGSEGRAVIPDLFSDYAFTDDPSFVERFSYLDEGVSSLIASLYPDKCSGDPTTFPEKSYGPTLAILTNDATNTPNTQRYSPLEAYVLHELGKSEASLRSILYTLRDIFKQ